MPTKNATELRLDRPNAAGELEEIALVLKRARVNIESFAATTKGQVGTIRLIFADRDTPRAHRALRDADYRWNTSQVRKILLATVSDQPGSLARLAHKLSSAKVNVDSAYMVSESGRKNRRTTLALSFKNGTTLVRARRALK